MSDERFHRLLGEVVRDLNAQRDIPDTLDRLVEIAIELLPMTDHVGVSLVEHRAIRTPAATSERLRELDEAQYDLGQGPCREAIRAQSTVTVGDLESDPRWPQWGEAMVRELGIRSSLSFRLFTDDEDSWGALNLYSYEPHAFSREDIDQGQTVAEMASVVLARAINDEQLARALATRTTIGQATGILMERFGLDPDPAFDVLRRLSSQQNLKLRDVAEEVVRTRRLPAATDA